MADDKPAGVPKLTYTVAEAVQAIGIGRSSLYQLIATGELASFRWCGRRLIRVEDLKIAIDRAAGVVPDN